MNKIVIFFILIFLTSGCSFNKNSKFWTASQNIPEESNPNYQEIFAEEEALNKELNTNPLLLSLHPCLRREPLYTGTHAQQSVHTPWPHSRFAKRP